MPGERIRPPRWLKPMNKVFMAMMRLPADEVRPLLRRFPTLVPTGVEFMKRSGLITDGRPEEFEALAGRCAVFRVDPVNP